MDQYCMRSHELGSFIKNSSKRNFRLSIKASKIIGISKNETTVQTSDQSRDLVNKVTLTLTMMIICEYKNPSPLFVHCWINIIAVW